MGEEWRKSEKVRGRRESERCARKGRREARGAW